jgi:hypothetical protein
MCTCYKKISTAENVQQRFGELSWDQYFIQYDNGNIIMITDIQESV